jgi:CheY-like chemotaxis protein
MNETDSTGQEVRTDGGEPVEILLAEDNPNDVEMTQRAFDKGKFLNNLHVVNDGIDAMQFLRNEGEYADTTQPDIILLDLEMPRMDGKEVLAELEDDPALSQIPVIVLTTSEAEQDIIESYKHSANAYMTKPVGYKEFQKIVREIETFWFELVKLPSEK